MTYSYLADIVTFIQCFFAVAVKYLYFMLLNYLSSFCVGRHVQNANKLVHVSFALLSVIMKQLHLRVELVVITDYCWRPWCVTFTCRGGFTQHGRNLNNPPTRPWAFVVTFTSVSRADIVTFIQCFFAVAVKYLYFMLLNYLSSFCVGRHVQNANKLVHVSFALLSVIKATNECNHKGLSCSSGINGRRLYNV